MIKLLTRFFKKDGNLRGLAYVAIGKFARRIPNVISSDIKLVQNFFNALAMVVLRLFQVD